MGDMENKVRWGRPGNNLKIGLVGLPNVGKSSTFNLFGSLQVAAENYPFCTIEPSNCVIPVPDERFEKLCHSWQPKSRVPAVLNVTDIAGLVKGASEGQGLGNKFLSHIQAVDAIYHVCRAFIDKEIEHVEGDVNPVRDFDIIGAELCKKDVEFVSSAFEQLKKKCRAKKSKEQEAELDTLERALAHLEAGKQIRHGEWNNMDVLYLNTMQLLTAKPVVYLVNISEKNYIELKNKWFQDIKTWMKTNAPADKLVPYSVTFEQKIQKMEPTEREAFLKENKTISMIPKIITVGFKALECYNYFTTGPDEVRAWTIRAGLKAPAAAGVIHTDFEAKFIKAEVYNYNDFMECGGKDGKSGDGAGVEKAVKGAGKSRTQGKEYTVVDGDIMFILHGAGGGKK